MGPDPVAGVLYYYFEEYLFIGLHAESLVVTRELLVEACGI